MDHRQGPLESAETDADVALDGGRPLHLPGRGGHLAAFEGQSAEVRGGLTDRLAKRRFSSGVSVLGGAYSFARIALPERQGSACLSRIDSGEGKVTTIRWFRHEPPQDSL